MTPFSLASSPVPKPIARLGGRHTLVAVLLLDFLHQVLRLSGAEGEGLGTGSSSGGRFPILQKT
eukprot:3970604-Amphidinium_carterae.1